MKATYRWIFIRTADELMMAQTYRMKTAVAVFIRKTRDLIAIV